MELKLAIIRINGTQYHYGARLRRALGDLRQVKVPLSTSMPLSSTNLMPL